MSGLRQYARDPLLAQRLGDPDLRLPAEDELLRLVALHLCKSEAPRPISARWIFARWKPGLALVGTWQVSFEGDLERMISWKSYRGPKATGAAATFRVNKHMSEGAAPLEAFAFVPEHSALIASFPADRVLRGAARVLALRRLGRSLDEAGLWPGRVFRRRSSRIELLRYKPERRAVLRLDAKLKRRGENSQEPAGQQTLAVRVLEPKEAQRVIDARKQCTTELLPELRHAEPEAGLLFEEWIEGEALAWDGFEEASAAARTLACLHAQSAQAAPHSPTREGAYQLLARVPGLLARAQSIPCAPPSTPRCWIHGDFHPDQFMLTQDGLRLLDVDALQAGIPEQDFASWIADHLCQDPTIDCKRAAEPLFEGYGAAAHKIDRSLLTLLVGEQLVQRAAATLRRLEHDADRRSGELLDLALSSRAKEPVL